MLDIVIVVVVVDIVVVASLSQVALNWKRATFHAIYCTYLRITDRQLRIEARQFMMPSLNIRTWFSMR